MDDQEIEHPRSKLRWLQISLRSLLAIIFGFGLGLAVNYQFRADKSRLPDPSNIRRGDKRWRAKPKLRRVPPLLDCRANREGRNWT